MKRSRLLEMYRAMSFDVETHLIQAGLLAPPLVCGSVAWFDQHAHQMHEVLRDAEEQGLHDQADQIRAVMPRGNPIQGRLLREDHAVSAFESYLETQTIIVGANIAFDLLVMAVRIAREGRDPMPGIFRMLAEDRVWDVQIAEALDAVAAGCLNMDPRSGGPLINPDTGRRGRYSLATCVDLVLGRADAKVNDEWRERYAELHPIPIEQWPQTARDYPVDDAVNTLEVGLAQAGVLGRASYHRWGAGGSCEWCGQSAAQIYTGMDQKPCRARRRSRNAHDLSNQVWTAFAMHAAAAWGFRVNQASVDLVEADALNGRDDKEVPFLEAKLLKRDRAGEISRDMSAIARRVATAYGARADAPCSACEGTGKVPSEKSPKSRINCKTCAASGFDLDVVPNLPKTETGRIGTGRDVLNESGDELLMQLADHQEDSKTLEVYVPYLRNARRAEAWDADGNPTAHRDVPLTLWPNVLLETGRTSYGGCIQLFPRKAGHYAADGHWVPSLRECIESRPGTTFSSEDYDSGELVTHAQSSIWLTGDSQLARALVNGIKVHNALGATMIGMHYDEFQKRVKEQQCKDARQAAKPGNFGFPGGMGPHKMVLQQRKQGPDTPHPSGPTWVKDDSGARVRGYKGLRFCLLMDKAAYCGGDKMITEWRDRPIAPTCEHCIKCAVRLKDAWLTQWPENNQYFEFINDVIEHGQVITAEMLELWPHLRDVYEPGHQLAPGEAMQHVSGRVRGGLEYCAAANGYFQGLLADLAKSALRRISRECYDNTVRVPELAHENSVRSAYAGGPSPLVGSRVIVFAHDEIIAEHPDAMAHDGATRISEIMVDEMRFYCPDLAKACAAEPTLMKKWFKGAAAVRDANGRLIPWEPKARAA